MLPKQALYQAEPRPEAFAANRLGAILVFPLAPRNRNISAFWPLIGPLFGPRVPRLFAQFCRSLGTRAAAAYDAKRPLLAARRL
jgi:hypothetical protein